jgi:hypothetical protein
MHHRAGMVLVQLLLPQTDPEGQPLGTAVATTRAELVERFGGITAYLRSAALGAWVNPEGRVERDDVVMVEVIADAFDRPWWRDYRRVLEERFRQREVLVRAWPMEIP